MLAAQCEAYARKHKSQPRRRVLIVTDSEETGKRLAGQISGLYGENKIATDGDGYKDFSLVFDHNSDKIDKTINDFNGAVSEYIEAHPEEFGYVVNGNPENDHGNGKPDPETDKPDPEDSEDEKPDYTTYIIIGAAALIIIVLLLEK